MRTDLAAWLLLLASCTGDPSRTGAIESDSAAGLTRCAEPLPESCGSRQRSFDALPSTPSPMNAELPGDYVPMAGQMTEDAANAKRLFDHERWADASQLLERVAGGEAGDDEGNRQIAEYHLAIALMRQDDHNAAQDLFILIAEHPSHLKFKETLLWLAQQAIQSCRTRRAFHALVRYDEAEVQRFKNPQQMDLHRRIRFARARALLDLGRSGEATAAFQTFADDPEYADAARECLALIR